MMIDRPTPGFRASISDVGCYLDGLTLLGMAPHEGSLPSPFDARDGGALAGPAGHHPLPQLDARDLLVGATDGLEGSVEVAEARVGEAIRGRVVGRGRRRVLARGARLRLVGLLAVERDLGHTEALGDQAHTEAWTEVRGRLFETWTSTEVTLPREIDEGATFEVPFEIPAPRLGPPSLHAGIALVAWAIQAHWDMERGFDEHLAAVVEVLQHPDLLRAGVMDLGAGAMADVWSDAGATFTLDPAPPLVPGKQATLSVEWPGAPDGRSTRIELQTTVRADRSLTVSSVVLPVSRAELAGTPLTLPIPADLPPTLAVDGLVVSHRVRAIVDRAWRADASVERLVAVG